MMTAHEPMVILSPEKERVLSTAPSVLTGEAYRSWVRYEGLTVPSCLIWAGVLYCDHASAINVKVRSHPARTDLALVYEGPKLTVARLMVFSAVLAHLKASTGETFFGRPQPLSLGPVCRLLGLTRSGKTQKTLKRHLALLAEGTLQTVHIKGPASTYFCPRFFHASKKVVKVLQAPVHYMPLPLLQISTADATVTVDGRWRLLLDRGWTALSPIHSLSPLARLFLIFLRSHSGNPQVHSIAFLAELFHQKKSHAYTALLLALQELKKQGQIASYENTPDVVRVWLCRFALSGKAVNAEAFS